MVGEYLDALNEDMAKAFASLKKDQTTVRTGRASPALLANVRVEVASYGSASMPLNQLASVQAPDARMLVVSPWDKSTLGDCEKAIGSAGLGLNPSNDGQVIRVPVPALTDERRRDLVKVVRKQGEDAKQRARGVRREYNDIFKELEKDKDISEDELKRVLKLVQDATDGTVKKIAAQVSAKEKELLDE